MHCGDTLYFDPDLTGINSAVQVDPSASPNPHLWIVLTEPQPPDHQVVIVNITENKQRSDTTVVLHPGDHPFIRKESVVRYGDALIVDARLLDECVKGRKARLGGPCSADLLNRIQVGVSASIFTHKKIAAFCTGRF